MHVDKHGELELGSGRKVRNPRQAVAIGLSEAGASRRERRTDAGGRRRTEDKERKGQTARQQKRRSWQRGKIPRHPEIAQGGAENLPRTGAHHPFGIADAGARAFRARRAHPRGALRRDQAAWDAWLLAVEQGRPGAALRRH